MQWTAAADAKMCMYILKIHNVKLDYAALAEAMGDGVTASALQTRISRLRSSANADNAQAPSSANKAPRRNANRGTAKGFAMANDNEDDDSDMDVNGYDLEDIKKEDVNTKDEKPKVSKRAFVNPITPAKSSPAAAPSGGMVFNDPVRKSSEDAESSVTSSPFKKVRYNDCEPSLSASSSVGSSSKKSNGNLPSLLQRFQSNVTSSTGSQKSTTTPRVGKERVTNSVDLDYSPPLSPDSPNPSPWARAGTLPQTRHANDVASGGKQSHRRGRAVAVVID